MIEQSPKPIGQVCMEARQDMARGVPGDQAYKGAFAAEASRLPQPDPSAKHVPFAMPPVLEKAAQAREAAPVKRGPFGNITQ
jgi:hypothetical protein